MLSEKVQISLTTYTLSFDIAIQNGVDVNIDDVKGVSVFIDDVYIKEFGSAVGENLIDDGDIESCADIGHQGGCSWYIPGQVNDFCSISITYPAPLVASSGTNEPFVPVIDDPVYPAPSPVSNPTFVFSARAGTTKKERKSGQNALALTLDRILDPNTIDPLHVVGPNTCGLNYPKNDGKPLTWVATDFDFRRLLDCTDNGSQELAAAIAVNPDVVQPDDAPQSAFRCSANLYIGDGVTATTVSFKGVTVAISPDVTITVRKNATLFIGRNANNGLRSNLFACKEMWNRIVVEPGGILEINTGAVADVSRISDAKEAVYCDEQNNLTDQITLRLRNVLFENNHVDVHLLNGDFPYGTNVNETYFRGVTFTGPENGITKHTTADPPDDYYGSRTFAHIQLDNVSEVQIGDINNANYKNTFENSAYGIYSTNSSYHVINNKFSNCFYFENEEPGITIKHGAGIFARSDDGEISTVVIDDNASGFPNKFINCHTGILTTGIANLTIQKNNKDAQDGGFEACYNSIMIYNAPENSVTTVTANDATEYNYGLQMFDLGQNSKFYVDGNWFNCDDTHNPLSFNASTASYKAISIQNILTVEVVGTVLGNIISNTQKGIHLRNIANRHAGQIQIGIANPNSYSNQVHYLNAPAPTGNDHYFGYWFENCDNLEVDNNIALSNSIPLGNGIDKRFRGFSVDNTTNSNFCSNKAEQMGSGVWVYNKCGGTYFMGTNTTSNWHNFHMANADLPDQDGSGHDLNNAWSNAGSTYDFAGSIASGVAIYWYTYAYSTTIKETGSGLQFLSIVDQTSGSISNCQTAQVPADDKRKENFGSAVTDTTDYGVDFPEENKYQDKEAFYNAALKDSTILMLGLPDDVVFQNAFDSLSQTSIAAIAEVKQLLDSDNVSAAMTMNSGIAPVNTIETNSKAAHQLLAAYKQYDSLTSAQKGQAHSIAVQTSLEGGMDVYTMRALLNEDVVDDIDASANMRKAHHQDDAVQKESIKNKDKLFPNPGANAVTFASSHEFTDKDVLVVYNLLQQAIAEYKLVGKSKNYSFDISWLQQGIYYVKHIRGSIIVTENKLVIIR